MIKSIRSNCSAQWEKIATLLIDLEMKEELITNLSEEVSHFSVEAKDQSLHKRQLEQAVKEEREEQKEKIKEFDYDLVNLLSGEMKGFLKEAMTALDQQTEEIENIEHAISFANEWSERITKAESALEDALRRLAAETAETGLLTEQLRQRNLELLTCKHPLRECSEQTKVKQRQINSLIAASQPSKRHIEVGRRQKSEISDCVKKMAQNLSGTLCNSCKIGYLSQHLM
jgi:chromosome segregation ATPase